MSLFSHLFTHGPKPAPPLILDRDAEFQRTITFLYRKDLGRTEDPSLAEIAGWMNLARRGYTGEQLEALISDTPEARAFRDHPAPVTPTNSYALVGRLVQRNGIFYDDTGPRLPQFYHCMPLIRIFHDNKELFRAICLAGATAGRHGIRFGAPLVEDEHQDGDYWVGCHVPPDMALDLLPDVVDALGNYGLRAHLFGAYYFGDKIARRADWNAQRQFTQALVDRLRGDRSILLALYEWMNEWNLTSPWGLSQESYDHAGEAMQIVRDGLGCLCTMGSPGEDDGYIAGTIRHGDYVNNDQRPTPSLRPEHHGDVAALDFMRGLDGPAMIKHIDRGYYDGRYHRRYQGAAEWAVEPDGLNDGGQGDVYSPMDEHDRASYFGYQMRMALDGMAVSFLNGPGIRAHYPIDTGYGFHEFPALIREWVPQDIGEWTGPTFMVKDQAFVTVLAEAWGYIGSPSHPLRTIDGRAVRTWRALFHDGTTIEGTGPIGLEPGWKAVLVKGEFA